MISVLKCAWRPNIIYFLNYLLFIYNFLKSLFFNGAELSKNINFIHILINTRKIPKNIKFDLQAYFNMEIILNGSDRLFGL